MQSSIITIKYNLRPFLFLQFTWFQKAYVFVYLHHSAGLETIRPRIEIKMKPQSNNYIYFLHIDLFEKIIDKLTVYKVIIDETI